ncbi:MAG: hypothetical protein LBP60_09905 [Spirochaetaceae bacterium]|jgi:hypothetical protein|nr:hypothetical protein [Spirochaetaceae bacterium]
MTINELQNKLIALIQTFPASGFDSVPDSTIADLETSAGDAEKLGMPSGKKLLENLAAALKSRKTGGNTDESVQVRFTALDFYIKNLQSGDTEDL